MKRFSWREIIILMAAPLCLIGLGIWGPPLREQWWPAQPRIECEVRPPTPLEISQGAQIGVTARAIVPVAHPYRFLKFQVVNYSEPPVWFEERARSNKSYHKQESHQAYRWNFYDPRQESLVAEVNLPSRNASPTLAQQFELATKDIAASDPVAARRANFSVTKAVLMYIVTKGVPMTQQYIDFYMEDVSDESQGLITFPQCVGKWIWQDSKSHSLSAAVPSWVGTGPEISRVQVRIDTAGLQVSPPKGTKISGLLSINHGWPQEITVEWPEKLTENSAQTEMKFTTKLAPLPSSLPEK